MTAIHETAYPRIRSNVTDKELVELYTPTEEQLSFASENAQAPVQKLGLLVLLKSFQRLGYFPMLREIPPRVIRHIAGTASLEDGVFCPTPRKGIFQDSLMICQSAKPGVEFGSERGTSEIRRSKRVFQKVTK